METVAFHADIHDSGGYSMYVSTYLESTYFNEILEEKRTVKDICLISGWITDCRLRVKRTFLAADLKLNQPQWP